MLTKEKQWSKILEKNYRVDGSMLLKEQIAANDKLIRVNNNLMDDVYQNMVDMQKEMVIRILPNYTIAFANQSLCSFLGIEKEMIIGSKLVNIIPQFFSPEYLSFLKPESEQNSGKCIMMVDNIDNKGVWIEWNSNYLKSETGDLLEFQIMGRDISYQKQIEEELKLSKKRCSNIVCNQSELVVCLTPDMVLTCANDACCEFFNKRWDDLRGRSFLDFIYEPDRDAIKELIKCIGREGPELVYPWRIIKADGDIGWQEWKIRAVFGEDAQVVELQAVGRNNHERQEMERALKESDAYYRAVFESTGTAMMIYKFDMTVILVNTEFEKLSGYSREEIHNKLKWSYFIHEQDLDKMREYHYRRQLDPRSVPSNYEFRLVDRWGSIKNIFLTVSVIPENEAIVVSFMDITERKNMEHALLQSEKRYISILNACPNELSISTIDEGRFIDVNQQMCKTLGRSYEEIIGHTALELDIWANPADRQEMVGLLNKFGSVRNMECNILNRFGEEIITLISAEVLEIAGKKCMILISNDITDKKRLEKEMARLDQLNLIGEMAAGIGHEVRNPMTSVRGFLQLLKDNDIFAFYQEYFDIMIDEIDRANNIITEFLSMARHKNVNLQFQNINSIIMAVAPLIKANAVSQEKYLDLQLHDVPDLMLDEKEIRQMILNLSRNGLEAMETEKRLSISTFVKSNKVVLSVRDEGTGIDSDILDKMGIPFFTTKDAGTGLGLSVCYSIAERHNAKIQVATGSNGTELSIYFEIPVI